MPQLSHVVHGGRRQGAASVGDLAVQRSHAMSVAGYRCVAPPESMGELQRRLFLLPRAAALPSPRLQSLETVLHQFVRRTAAGSTRSKRIGIVGERPGRPEGDGCLERGFLGRHLFAAEQAGPQLSKLLEKPAQYPAKLCAVPPQQEYGGPNQRQIERRLEHVAQSAHQFPA